MANQATGLLQHLRLLFALSTSLVPTLPMKRSPYEGCEHYSHTRTLWLSWGAPLQWFHGLPSWGGKFAVPATSAAPERKFSLAGNIMTKKRARLSSDDIEGRVATRGLAESEGVDDYQEGSLGVVAICRPHARTHAQTHTLIHKKPSGSYSLFLLCDTKKKLRSFLRLSLLVVQI